MCGRSTDRIGAYTGQEIGTRESTRERIGGKDRGPAAETETHYETLLGGEADAGGRPGS